MATAVREYSPLPEKKGFQRWVKLSLDDLPLIRPPKHHMVVQMTGGLTNLYKKIAEDKKEKGSTDPDVPTKPDDQLELEKPGVVRVSFVKFYTDKRQQEEERKLLGVDDEDDEEEEAARKLKEKEEKLKEKDEKEKSKINGEEPMDETSKKSNGEIDGLEKMDCDSEDKADTDDTKDKAEAEKENTETNKTKNETDKETEDKQTEKDSENTDKEENDAHIKEDGGKKDSDTEMKDCDKDLAKEDKKVEAEKTDAEDKNSVKDDKVNDTDKRETDEDKVDNAEGVNKDVEKKDSDTDKESDSGGKDSEKEKTEEEEKADKNASDKIDDEGGGAEKGEGKKSEAAADKVKDKTDSDSEMETNGKAESKSDKDEDDEEDSEEEEEEEETTDYTDEDGEFVPLTGMPLLAGRYKYLQVLGRGQSALIVKAEDTFCNNRPLAIKVLHRVYKPIGSQEADILLELHRADPYLHVPFARIKTQFLYGPHYCLVFEGLSPTPLYTHYDQRDIRGASSLPYIRQLAVKLLTVMGFLHKQNVIHADLKPENILLAKEDDLNSIMVVDFGNALRNTEEELSLYYSDFELQTLLYRAPEVIFGLRFSLEVDMWSLGCLLAECYIGKPLFMGKTKQDILSKISKLLGPFPKEFSEGECGDEFASFIGRPLSRYQRMQNLAKRLNRCTDIHFLMLIEKMLTYLPERRMVPAEAACHPFVAYISPYLYLTPSPGLLRYPTVVLDMTTYPFLPEAVDEDSENHIQKTSRKRLLSYAHPIKPLNVLTQGDGKGNLAHGSSHNNGNNNITTTTTADSVMSINKQNKTVSIASTSSSQTAVSRSDVKETLKSMGLRCEDFTISVYSKEQAHAILRKQGVEVTNHTSHGGGNASRQNQMQQQNRQQQYMQNQRGSGGGRNSRPSGNVQGQGFRSGSVSVGRPPMTQSRGSSQRSVSGGNYQGGSSRSFSGGSNNAQDDDDDDCVILDPPDNPRSQAPKAASSQSRLPQQFQLMGTTVQVNRGAKRPYSGPQNPMSSKRSSRSMQGGYPQQGNYHHQQQHSSYRQMQQQQQQQRYGSRQRQQQYHQMQQQQQYMDDYSDEDSGGETSVQDTLKRLKNYNISITCRRNEPHQRNMGGQRNMMGGNRQMGGQMGHYQGGNMRMGSGGGSGNMRSGGHINRGHMMRGENMNMMRQGHMMRNDSDYDDEHPMDSEEDTEADMAKYLECEIGEEENMMGMAMVEGDEELHFDDDDEDDMGEMPPQGNRMMSGHPGQQRHPGQHRQGYVQGHRGSGGNRDKGKSTQPQQPPKRIPRRDADTSIEEVTLSKDSEGEYADLDAEDDEREQLRADAEGDDEDNLNTSSIAEIDDEEGREQGDTEAAANSASGAAASNAEDANNEDDEDADGSKIVDNLLERHLNAVCNEAADSPAADDKTDGATKQDAAVNEAGCSAKSSPGNSKDNSRANTPAAAGEKNGSAEQSQTNSPVNEDELLGGGQEKDDDDLASEALLAAAAKEAAPDALPVEGSKKTDDLAEDEEIDEELEKELLGVDEDL